MQSASPARTARLVIVDDHELARAGLRSILAAERGLELVGEAVNGREAVALCRRLRPDLALIDVRMPDMDGLAATRAIKQESPHSAVIVITMHENPDYLFEALRAGAAGYVLKGATGREIITAVRQVLRGERVLNAAVSTQLLHRMAGTTSPTLPPGRQLTAREIEVLGLLAQGKTNREIGRELHLSLGTVKAHVEHILTKLEVADRTQAAVRAVDLGLFPPVGPRVDVTVGVVDTRRRIGRPGDV